MNHQDQDDGSQRTADGHQHHRAESQVTIHQDARHRSYRQGETSEPRSRVVGLRALERLTGVDDQRAGQDHLSQSERGPEGQTLQQDSRESAERRLLVVKIIEGTQREPHQQDGPDTGDIAPVVLHEKRGQAAQQEQACAEGRHRQSRLHGTEVLGLHQPARQHGNQDADRRREQQVRDGHQPEVAVPEVDMYGRILGVHSSWIRVSKVTSR